MNYQVWDVVSHVLEFDVDDEAGALLYAAGPWKIITGMCETPVVEAKSNVVDLPDTIEDIGPGD